ncbi:MAG: glycerol-3-phosphate ABC transporter permease [Spirochaetae bacterium HGW-Spirochaetae-8]|jgi:multiple sugar transport system permease protein/sn-glycerol 3-phosphate transport system permease protein|nr:MAG: glycerol-3-phosphate ABC transporter permease [Spirochaetae bacterium HGW-Spirochaetae-8]
MEGLLHKKNATWYIGRFFTHAVLILASIIIGLPFVWMVTTSIKSPAEVAIFPPIWWPETVRWDNFSKAWSLAPFGRFYINSIITASTGVVLEVLIAALSAFAFARIRFKYSSALFIVMLAAMMIPGQIALIPNYVMLSKLKWINTYQGIVIPHVSSVFGAFLLRQYFLTIPSALYDAAEIDGLGHFRTMLHIALPLARPVLGTLVLYLFISKWNSYLWPLIVTNTQNMRTLPVGLAMVRSAEYAIGPEHLMAASLFVLVPVLIIYFIAQKQLIEGIAAGAVKG